MDCPFSRNGNCEIATKLAKRAVPIQDAACRACEREPTPRSENRVTASLALHHNRGADKDKYLLHMATGRLHLAGYMLERRIHRWMRYLNITPPTECNCGAWIKKMNEWGVEESLNHLDEIADHLLESMRSTYLSPLAVGFVSKPILRRVVRSALLHGAAR